MRTIILYVILYAIATLFCIMTFWVCIKYAPPVKIKLVQSTGTDWICVDQCTSGGGEYSYCKRICSR